MSLQTGLSGINGAQTGLDTVSNDLANASTTAFKSQTALFADVYPANVTNTPGIGVATSSISSNLTQGDTVSTGNPLDAAIQGSGYFITSQNGQQEYTRDGSFQLSTTGQLITATGGAVQGYTVTNGNKAGTLSGLTINTGAVSANPTSAVGLTLNLNSGDTTIPAATAFNASNSSTYNEATSVVAYDSLGNADKVNLYFRQIAPAVAGGTPTWDVYAEPVTSSGTVVSTPTTPLTTLTFSTSGALTGGSPVTLSVPWGNGSATSSIAFNLTGTTLGAQSFAIAGTTNDGYAPGNYTGTSINSSGQVQSTYSNGQTVTNGVLGIANFINPEGLEPVSGNLFTATNTSGTPVVDTAGTGQAGVVVGGSLEQSNASTSSLLVQLIQYQQAYQANASVIQTEQQDGTRISQI